jgi:hypothetical protein
MKPEDWLSCVLTDVAANRPSGFAGLGLVLYLPPVDLPVAPLMGRMVGPPLPCAELAAATALLSELSDVGNPLHDGFHLVNAKTLEITHLCQFFAPPIPEQPPESIPSHAVGSRFMAALFGSMLPSVAMTAIIGDREGALLMIRGSIRRLSLRVPTGAL